MRRLRLYWDFIRTSLWFLPLLMSVAGVLTAVALLTWGEGLIDSSGDWWLLHTGDADNARELMSALLTGMISMTALVVSITMVVLTLAAGQIGPRLIRSFMQDRVTQSVLGLFLADILFLLTVFQTINARSEQVPHLAVSVGTLLTAVCLLVLLLFVHRLARSIIYDHVIHNLAAELRTTVRDLMPDAPSDREPPPPPPPPDDRRWVAVGQSGYIQSVDIEALVATAQAAGAVLRLDARPGDFVLARGQHIAITPADAWNEDVCGKVRAALIVGSERTPTQDIEYGLRQMVEIATRALSPGLNDVFTAMAVIDNLSAALAEILPRGLEPVVIRDEAGVIRLIRTVSDHEAIIGGAFDQIRHAGRANPAILLRLTQAIGRLASVVGRGEQRRLLLEQADMILAAGEANLSIPRDLSRLRAVSDEVRANLRQD